MYEKPGFELKVRVLDLAVEREMQNGFHPHLPRKPLYRSSWKNCSREQCFFFSACYACACQTTVLSKTVQIFSRIPEILITKGQISLVYQPHRPATPHDNRPLNSIFFVWSIDTNVFSMNFNQEIMISVVCAHMRNVL